MNTQTQPSLLRRLGAILYDTILLCALLLMLSLPWVMITENGSELAKWGLRIIAVCLVSGFFIYFWIKSGQTLGMTTWRIRLISLENDKLSLKQVVIRLLTASISIACLGLGYIWMLIDKDQLTWHDRMSKTGLVLLPKKKK